MTKEYRFEHGLFGGWHGHTISGIGAVEGHLRNFILPRVEDDCPEPLQLEEDFLESRRSNLVGLKSDYNTWQ